MATISIKYRDIPEWLHQGDFYRNLNSDAPDEIIDIPADCFAEDYMSWTIYTKNEELFRQLIRVTMFWMLDEIPLGVLEFCVWFDADIWHRIILDIPGAKESKIFEPLVGVYPLRDKRTVPFELVIATGKMEVILHVASRMVERNLATACAANVGNLPVMKYLREHGFKWDEQTCWRASATGNLQCLQYAHENGCPWNEGVYMGAIQNGHLNCMQYAHQKGLKWPQGLCEYAAQVGNTECLKYLHENGCAWDDTCVCYAAQHGRAECLQYLLEQDCPIHEDACDMACLMGHVSCLQLLHEHGADVNLATCCHAALSSDVLCLQYLHEHQCVWDHNTTQHAAENGRVVTLRYALQQGCDYQSHLVLAAAHSCVVECVEYLVEEQMLIIDEVVFLTALLKGNLACVQYLIDQGCPYLGAVVYDGDNDVEAYDHAFVKDNPEFTQCVRYAVERGWEINYAFCKYVSTRDERCVAYLKSEGLFMEEDDIREDEEIVAPELIEILERLSNVNWSD